jgi:hypothetical protein
MSDITMVGLDLAKNVFQLHGVDARGHQHLARQVKRAQLMSTVAQLPPCTIAMEACAGAHHWARGMTKLGHTVKIMSPQFVKPYVKGNKTDRNDAAAICEAAGRPDMRFVPVKSIKPPWRSPTRWRDACGPSWHTERWSHKRSRRPYFKGLKSFRQNCEIISVMDEPIRSASRAPGTFPGSQAADKLVRSRCAKPIRVRGDVNASANDRIYGCSRISFKKLKVVAMVGGSI